MFSDLETSQSASVTIAARIQALQADRQAHAQAIQAIDDVLSKIGEALGMQVDSTGRDTPVRHKGKFAQTAENSVLGFIRSRTNPSTADINAHWRAEGRKGTANVTLLKLLKQQLIRRAADPTIQGSRYLAQE